MRNGFYQHNSVTETEVAEAISATGEKVVARNANYFNGNELEKFERVIVDDGQNTDAIKAAYKEAGVEVVSLDQFLAKGKKPASASAAKAPAVESTSADAEKASDQDKSPSDAKSDKPVAAFNPDAPRTGKKAAKKQGEPKPE